MTSYQVAKIAEVGTRRTEAQFQNHEAEEVRTEHAALLQTLANLHRDSRLRNPSK